MEESESPATSHQPLSTKLAPVVCLLPLLGWWLYGLFDLDEGFYAAVVAEMNRRGEWITPYFNGKPWFEKPILLYWLAKPSLAVFGGEFGIRLPSILASLATYGLLAWFGRRRLGPHSGTIAALVLATSFFFVLIGRMALVDPILVTCLTGAFLMFWESLVGDRRWRILSAALLGAAVLAKGPVSCVLFVAVGGYTFWRERELRPAFRGGWFAGMGVFSLVVAAWYVPAYIANGQMFVQRFLIEQNFQRFRGGDEAHAVSLLPLGFLYYVPWVLVGMLPWSLFVIRAWPRRALAGTGGEEFDKSPEGALYQSPGRKPWVEGVTNPSSEGATSPRAYDDAPRRYLATWAVVVFVFFTLSGTKLPHYILPCFPPLALLVGHDLATRWQGLSRLRINLFSLGAAGLATLLTFTFWAYYEATNAGPKRFVNAYLPGQARLGGKDWPGLLLCSFTMFRLGKQHRGLYPPAPKGRLFGRWEVPVNETSTPSLIFYLTPYFHEDSNGVSINGSVVESDDLQVLIDSRLSYVLTRPGRLTPADITTLHLHGLVAEERSLGPNSSMTSYEIYPVGDFVPPWSTGNKGLLQLSPQGRVEHRSK